jgi:hypothetical protein
MTVWPGVKLRPLNVAAENGEQNSQSDYDKDQTAFWKLGQTESGGGRHDKLLSLYKLRVWRVYVGV